VSSEETLEPPRHLLPRPDQPAQEELRNDEDRHELDRLELGGGERRDEQAQRHAEYGGDDRDEGHRPGRARGVQAEPQVGHGRGDAGLRGGAHPEGEGVAGDEVHLGRRRGHQPLERPGGAFALHGDRGQQEHDREGEDRQQDQPDPVEHLRRGLHDGADEGDDERRDDEDERDGAVVAEQLAQDAPGGDERDAR
jgi:hypothetical protein